MTATTDVAGSGRSTDQLPLLATTDAAAPAQGESAGAAAQISGVETGGPAPAGSGVGPNTALPAQPRILGLDLSLTGTGMSDGITTWLVRSSGKKDDDLTKRQDRLRKLRGQIITPCDGVDVVVLEGPTYGTSTGHMHDRSGLWWLVVMALNHRGITVVEVSPPTLKKYATGKGNGPKGAMVESAARRLPHVQTAGDDNRADALWLYTMGLDHFTGQYVVPESHRVALKSVRWPARVGAA